MTIASCESGDFMRANGEYEQNTSENNQTQVHPDVVAYVESHMPDQDDLIDVAELFKAFGDLTRAKMNQSAVSHQLRMLKQVRLVKTRRDGKVRYYSLADEHIQKMFQVAFEHIMED